LGEQPLEEQPSVAAVTPVEAEHELVQVALQVVWVNAALRRAQQPALEQRRHPVHARQRYVRWQPGTLHVEGLVRVRRGGRALVGQQPVGEQHRACLDVLLEPGLQGDGLRVRDDAEAAPPEAARPALLHRDDDHDLVRRPAATLA